MGRNKVIDRASILDAAETVVTRDGASRMTLDAVAAQAKISKASVLYDYKTKQALIKAVIERRIEDENARVRQVMDKLGSAPNAAIRARIATAARSVSDEDRAVAINLCATLAQDAELRRPIQDAYRHRIAAVLETSEHSRGALLAFLAVEGLMSLERLGLHTWPEEEREVLLREIGWLVDQQPERVACDRDLDSS
ncbi:MAG TPA: TetR family transcriptional regulator [Arenibaculum sp.]|nr:TetR family transcriptional regulator [Arenibaculum sp.]